MSDLLEDLLEQSQRGGRLESVGQFTLDLDVALAKMRESQVENQLHYIHRLIRAAVILKAPRVEVECKHEKTRVSFPALACEPAALSKLLQSVLDGGHPALREVATAANLALALRPQLVEIKVSDGQTCRVMKIENDEAEVFETTAGEPGTVFQLKRSKGSALMRLGTEPPEYFNIFRRFRYCPIRLTINGKAVPEGRGWGEKSGRNLRIPSRPWMIFGARAVRENQHVVEARVVSASELNGVRLADSLACSSVVMNKAECADPGASTRGERGGGDYFVAIGLSADKSRASTASFVLWGESLQVFPVQLALPGVEILISAAGLDLDLSGERLIENERFEQRWQEARSYYKLLENALTEAYPGVSGRTLITRALHDNMHRWRIHLSLA